MVVVDGPAPGEVILSARDVTVSYPSPAGDVTPLNGFSIDVRAHEVIGLMGDAGSGKSTAALSLIGLVRAPGRIERGEVMFGGRDLLALDEEEVRAVRGKDIGVIVQNPRGALNPMLRVGRQIGNVYRAHNRASRSDSYTKAVEMLRLVGINDPERRVAAYAHELSGGMAQRALIAMALSSNPKLLIADEPTSGLDVTIQAQLLDSMWSSVQRTGSAILLVTQDLGIIANYCDRVAVLHHGRIVEDQPVRAFFAEPRHAYSRAVLELQRKGAEGRIASVSIAREKLAQPLVEIAGLSKSFPIRGSDKLIMAVQDVDLTIGEGETVGLVGESGSGKTTVGRCLLRLEEPTSGDIRFRGEPISGITKGALRKFRSRLQIVFQDPYDSVNPRWTVEQIISEPLRLHSTLNRKARRRRVAELLERVGLDAKRLDAKPRELGSGALQRLNVARAIATDPEFIVLDEPTSVLAPAAVASLIDLLRALQADLGLSYLFISHDLTTVKYLCHRVAVMYLGQIVEQGTVQQVFENPQHPYARALLASHLFPDLTSRRVDGPVREVLAGEIPSPVDLPPGCYLAGRCPFAVDACRTNAQDLTTLPDGRQVRCARIHRGELAA